MSRIVYIFNNKMAFPALQSLQATGELCAAIITDMHPEVMAGATHMCRQWNVPLCILSQSGFKTQLKDLLTQYLPDAVFVMTFPWRIPADILAMPRLGFFNFHHGKLPEMRGADPIFECVRQRMAEAGSSVHIMTEEFDNGPVVLQQTFPITSDFTYGMVSGRMAHLGVQMCNELASLINSGVVPNAIPQDESKAHYWPKAGADELRIDWNEMTWEEIKALVKACNPVTKGLPASINGWQIGVCDVSEVNLEGDTSALQPGTIIALDHQNGLLVYCKNGKALKLEVIYSEEGVMAGHKLAFWGIAPGHLLS